MRSDKTSSSGTPQVEAASNVPLGVGSPRCSLVGGHGLTPNRASDSPFMKAAERVAGNGKIPPEAGVSAAGRPSTAETWLYNLKAQLTDAGRPDNWSLRERDLTEAEAKSAAGLDDAELKKALEWMIRGYLPPSIRQSPVGTGEVSPRPGEAVSSSSSSANVADFSVHDAGTRCAAANIIGAGVNSARVAPRASGAGLIVPSVNDSTGLARDLGLLIRRMRKMGVTAAPRAELAQRNIIKILKWLPADKKKDMVDFLNNEFELWEGERSELVLDSVDAGHALDAAELQRLRANSDEWVRGMIDRVAGWHAKATTPPAKLTPEQIVAVRALVHGLVADEVSKPRNVMVARQLSQYPVLVGSLLSDDHPLKSLVSNGLGALMADAQHDTITAAANHVCGVKDVPLPASSIHPPSVSDRIKAHKQQSAMPVGDPKNLMDELSQVGGAEMTAETPASPLNRQPDKAASLVEKLTDAGKEELFESDLRQMSEGSDEAGASSRTDGSQPTFELPE